MDMMNKGLYGFWYLFCICVSFDIYAQGYYIEGTDVKAGEITYEVGYAWDQLFLFNVANVKDNERLVFADGSFVREDEYDGISPGEMNLSSLKSAVRETFTEAEYRVLSDGGDQLDVYLVESLEGKILELDFIIRVSPRTLALPPEKYALLEKNLKKHVRFTVTEDEKKLQFIRTIITIDFKAVGLNYLNFKGGEPIDAEELK